MAWRKPGADASRMSAAVLTKLAPTGSTRLLADVQALGGDLGKRPPASIRLEAALGRDLADKLVTALLDEPRRTG
jgi:hypothetical protein